MADIELESPIMASAPSTEVVSTTPPAAAEEDDIMAGTALSEQEKKDAEAAPAQPTPASTSTTSTPEERRKRAAGGLDDKKRAKRLFGGLLGTLDAFKKEERQRGASDAAKRRSLITDRIQNKLRTESHVMSDIATKERELKVLRYELDKKEDMFHQKSAAYTSRHAFLPRVASFLFTTVPKPTELLPATEVRRHPRALLPPPSSATASSIPLSQAGFQRPGDNTLRSLFYLPAVLLPEQELKIEEQKTAAEVANKEEQDAWIVKKDELRIQIQELKTQEPLLVAELASLRKQKIDLDSASSNSSSFPAPTNFASTNSTSNGNGNGEDRSRSNSVVVQQQQQQSEAQAVEEPVGDGMMDVEGDEDVEY